jgi:hypothetical protein
VNSYCAACAQHEGGDGAEEAVVVMNTKVATRFTTRDSSSRPGEA